MPRQRSAALELAKQLADAAQPIYLVDDRRVILYCNPACAAWARVAQSELVGQKCVYGPPKADPAPPAVAAAARLCPPPAALGGERCCGRVSATGESGALVFREAEFWPLSPETPTLESAATAARADAPSAPIARALPTAILVLVEPVDRPEPATSEPGAGAVPILSSVLGVANDEMTPDGLHAELTRWRHRFAGRYGLERMVGTSPAATRVRAQVALAAAAQTAVFISGPAGSGKEHVAKAIHYRRGAEAAGTLVPIACAALDVELTISTLRALARSSASEAPRRTLLLANVDALSLETQGLVMQLLGTSGSSRAIATAGQPAAQLVAEGKMRADLAAALATLSVELVSLGERIEDLPLLAQMFLEEVNSTATRQVAGFTPEALDQLAAYAWPANLDELAEVVRESHELSDDAQISPRDLPRRIHLAAEMAQRPSRRDRPIDLERLLAQIETELIERALAEAKGNKTRAAQLLGLTRPRLYRRLVQLGFEEADAADLP